MSEQKIFQASEEGKARAKQLRLFAILAWIVGIGIEVYAILKLINNEMLYWLIGAIVLILGLSILGSLLWKKANRLDPASEKDKVKFFIQSQLGALLAALCFLPLLLFILTNKNIDGKTKGIAGAVAGIALLAATIVGIDFNPPSIEKYTKEINQQTDSLKQVQANPEMVYWTRAGNKYHLYDDCYTIKNRQLSSGSVTQAYQDKGLSQICKICYKRAQKAHDEIPEQNNTNSSTEKSPTTTQ